MNIYIHNIYIYINIYIYSHIYILGNLPFILVFDMFISFIYLLIHVPFRFLTLGCGKLKEKLALEHISITPQYNPV